MKLIFRSLYSIILLGAGVMHFLQEKSFRRIIPKTLPFRKTAVIVTGVFEIMFAMLLWVKKGQGFTSKLLVFFMVAVFPANIYMAVKKVPIIPGVTISPWLLWLRLPLQIPLIIGALKLGRR